MNDGVHTKEAELEVAADIGDQHAKLAHLLATPAISREAEARRSWSIAIARRELARLERVLHGVRAEADPPGPRDGYALDDPKRLAFESRHW